MDSILKKGLFLVTLTGAMTVFPITAHAADIDDTQNMPRRELSRYWMIVTRQKRQYR